MSRREERLSCVIVCPNYYDLAHMLRLRVERSLGTEVEVRSLITRSDVDWDRLTADLVITTIDERPASEDVVVVQPFLTDHDVDAVQERRDGREWMDIGTGAWDSRRRPSEVRLNRVLRIDPARVRREGAALPRDVFDAVVEAARPYL